MFMKNTWKPYKALSLDSCGQKSNTKRWGTKNMLTFTSKNASGNKQKKHVSLGQFVFFCKKDPYEKVSLMEPMSFQHSADRQRGYAVCFFRSTSTWQLPVPVDDP